ncbi:MAG: bifunctional cytidylyltransferase/SDR family oxidoreductase [Cardiobacteriaceae bacterium]|nr:bifunctional cytidylyltransferase/SDR family oxidoreductase [Cardiobacteriaceae bacterium]
MTTTVAVILSGGVGQRMNLGYPKQFSKIAGKTALEHTVSVFQKHPEIDEIVIVSEENSIKRTEEIVAKAGFSKVNRIIFGGKERSDSTLSAITALQSYDDDSKVILHDAVRPLISLDIISACIAKLDEYQAVDVCIPAVDTIVKADPAIREIEEIPPRKFYWQGQTPQAFRLGTLKKAYEIYRNSDIQGTCDCSIVLKTLPNVKIGIVNGSAENIKLTVSTDLFIANKLLQSRSDFSLRNILSLDKLRNLSDKIFVVIGGTYGIGAEICRLAEKLGAKTHAFARSNGINVADIETVHAALKKVHDEAGRIDIVINTAGILRHKPLNLTTVAEISESIAVNFNGAVNVAVTAYPYLKEVAGCLINFTSSSYTRGRSNYSLYSSSKAAVANLTQALSEEWILDNIKVNCINPERTATPMRSNAFGIEPEETLLKAETVALATLAVLASSSTGNIVDVVKQDEKMIAPLLAEIKK